METTPQLPASPPVRSSDSFCPHDFKEEYYGWRCADCGQFYPNTAPLEAWLLGESASRDTCPHEPIEVANDEGLLDCVKCRYCGEVLLP